MKVDSLVLRTFKELEPPRKGALTPRSKSGKRDRLCDYYHHTCKPLSGYLYAFYIANVWPPHTVGVKDD